MHYKKSITLIVSCFITIVFTCIPLLATVRFIDNGDGTVTDTQTWLMWQKSDDGVTRTWNEAMAYADNLTFAGYSDWRAPSIDELRTTFESCYFIFSLMLHNNAYWSNSTHDYTEMDIINGNHVITFADVILVDGVKGSISSVVGALNRSYYLKAVRTIPSNTFILSASVSAANTRAPFWVNFISSASGGKEPYSYSWDFGDGQFSGDPSPQHTYSTAGYYAAKIRGTDISGNRVEKTLNVSIGISTSIPIIGTAENINWTVFTSRLQINTVLPSQDGNTLWVGTNGGLEKRDATTNQLLRLYTTLDGLPSNTINKLCYTDRSGGIFVGTSSGISHIGASGIPKPFWGSAISSAIGIASDYNGGIWLSGGSYILSHIKADGIFETFTEDNSKLPTNELRGIASDGLGGIFIASNAGLVWRQANGTFQVFNTFVSEVPSNDLLGVISDNSGGVWLWAVDKQIAHFTSDGKWQKQSNSDIPLYASDKGWEWKLSSTTIQYFQNGAWLPFSNHAEDGLPNNRILAITVQDNHSPVIYAPGGIYALENEMWQTWLNCNPDLIINFLSNDNAGGYYIGTPFEFTTLKADKSISPLLSLDFNSFFKNPDGSFYIGSNRGLLQFSVDRALIQDYGTIPGLSVSKINAVLSENGLWIGTDQGLAYQSKNGEWVTFTTANSKLKSNQVNFILPDDHGGIVAFSAAGNISHLDSSTWTFDTSNVLSEVIVKNGTVNAAISDNAGGFWVGVSGGLVHLKSDFSYDLFRDRLPSWGVLSLCDDK
ncbi:MAG: DUF1566 domain-containing protein, partial [Desulfobacterales bacterium]|nr:DUF1566 domain-containing protein [Desulfobacterales bacterium]